MLYLNKEDIVKAATPDQVMDAIEIAYALDLSGEHESPPRMHVNSGNNTLLYMPCLTDSIFGTKILSLFPGNADRGKAVIQGLMLLNDPDTGEPLALLDGARLTAVRTGAVGGVAVRHTTPGNAKTIGLIGAGIQGFHQIYFACQARSIDRVYLYDLSETKQIELAGKLKEALPGIGIETPSSVEKLVENSEIVITATPATNPVLPGDRELLKGRHYIGIGSYKPEMREFPRVLYSLVKNVYIDTEHGLEESGDLITPLQNEWISREQIVRFGEIIFSKIPPPPEGTTLFKSVGMALFDLVVSELIYRSALKNKIGTLLA